MGTSLVYGVIWGSQIALARTRQLYFGLLAGAAPFALAVAWMFLDDFGRYLAAAVTGVIFFQAVLTIGMNLGLLPVTGITLPFVRSGLSSVWTFLVAQGILQSILMGQRKLDFRQ